MSYMRGYRKVLLSLLVATGLPLAGCGTLTGFIDDFPGFFGTPELRPELAYVLDHADDFAQDPNDPLRDVPAGTVMDELSGLSGCWGAAGNFEFVLGQTLEEFEVYHFDATTGEMTWCGVTPDLFGFLDSTACYSGTFSLLDGKRLAFHVTEVTTVNPQTGEYETNPMPAGDESTWLYLVTLSSDRLNLDWVEGAGPGDQPPERNELIFQRFDCPE